MAGLRISNTYLEIVTIPPQTLRVANTSLEIVSLATPKIRVAQTYLEVVCVIRTGRRRRTWVAQ